MPDIAGMGGNAGAQALAVTVRGIALGEIDPERGRSVLLKEIFIGISTGICIGIITAFIAYFWYGNGFLGILVGGTLMLNLIIAGIAGVSIPFLLEALGQDPTLASTIFPTTRPPTHTQFPMHHPKTGDQ